MFSFLKPFKLRNNKELRDTKQENDRHLWPVDNCVFDLNANRMTFAQYQNPRDQHAYLRNQCMSASCDMVAHRPKKSRKLAIAGQDILRKKQLHLTTCGHDRD
jgi:hypothetical protein